MSDDLNCPSNFEMRVALLFCNRSHGEKRGIEMFQVYITHTHKMHEVTSSIHTHTNHISLDTE